MKVSEFLTRYRIGQRLPDDQGDSKLSFYAAWLVSACFMRTHATADQARQIAIRVAEFIESKAYVEPKFLVVCFDRCPFCGVGGERDILPIPFGAVNHKCSHCENIYSVRADGFSKTWKVPTIADVSSEESEG